MQLFDCCVKKDGRPTKVLAKLDFTQCNNYALYITRSCCCYFALFGTKSCCCSVVNALGEKHQKTYRKKQTFCGMFSDGKTLSLFSDSS